MNGDVPMIGARDRVAQRRAGREGQQPDDHQHDERPDAGEAQPARVLLGGDAGERIGLVGILVLCRGERGVVGAQPLLDDAGRDELSSTVSRIVEPIPK